MTARSLAGLEQHAVCPFDQQNKERNQFAFNVLDHEMDRYLFLEVPSEMGMGDILGSICRMLALLLGLVCTHCGDLPGVSHFSACKQEDSTLE